MTKYHTTDELLENKKLYYKIARKRLWGKPVLLMMTSIRLPRLFSFVVGGKECALITCCEEDDMSVMDGVRVPMERMCTLNKWKMADVI